jgi:nicotinamide-nucleotide adenylyltransferase
MAAMLPDHAAALQRLDSDSAFAALRFDDGPPLAGPVVVLPSAFNPPTRAHLHLLETAAALDDARPAALLSTRNVAKGVFGATLDDRVAMLLALHAAHPVLAVLATNAARLADQAAALRATFPAAAIDFVVGHDTLIRLFDPVYYDDMEAALATFFAHHRVIATNRGDASIDVVAAFVAESAGRFKDRIIVRAIDADPASLSSTGARTSVANGAAPAEVAPEVAAYIRDHALYLDP